MKKVRVKVAAVSDETSSIKTFRLERTDGSAFAPAPAGAHIDIVGPTEVTRQYSLCNAPDEGSYLVAVKLEPGSRGGSSALHGEVAVGTELEVSEPRNLLKVATDADRHVLVAAGIGITPMISIAYNLHRSNTDFELHYFARSHAEAAFTELLEERCGFTESVRFHFGVPREEQGTIMTALAQDAGAGVHVYTCGPVGFMDKVRDAFAPVIGEDQVHIEHFEAEEIDTSHDTSFEVELDTGEVFEIPADRSIVDVLQENGIEVDTSCKEGICGTCVMGVLEGVPEHRDNCLSTSEKAANDQMATCVSRTCGKRLLLELF